MLNLKNKKILITGGAGFLGQHLFRNLTEKRGVPKKNITIPRSAELDLRIKENAQKAVAGVDIVFHCAAVTGGIEFHKNRPGEVFYDNIMMGVHLIEAARKEGVDKFVTIGSAAEYPHTGEMPLREEAIWNGIPEENHVPYAIAKKMLLVQAQSYRQEYGFNAIHLLLTNMHGPGEGPDSTFVIPMLIRKIREAQERDVLFIDVWGTGRARRDFLYVEDAAEGIVLAAEHYNKSEPVNLGSGTETSIKELAETLCRLMGYKGKIRWDTSKPDGQLRRVLDISRAEKEFGFLPTVNLSDGLTATIKDMRSRGLI